MINESKASYMVGNPGAGGCCRGCASSEFKGWGSIGKRPKTDDSSPPGDYGLKGHA